MSSFTNPDGSSTRCFLVNSVSGPKELVKTTQEDCFRDFTCQYNGSQAQIEVKCPGKMDVDHYKQKVTNYYICIHQADCIYFTYPTSNSEVKTWKENGDCNTENGRSCCPEGTTPMPKPGELPRPPGSPDGPTDVSPGETNPFVPIDQR